MKTRDEIAQEKYGRNFSDLSAWSQDLVAREYNEQLGVFTPLGAGRDIISRTEVDQDFVPRSEYEKLAQDYEELKISYSDIWDENEDLKMEIESRRTK